MKICKLRRLIFILNPLKVIFFLSFMVSFCYGQGLPTTRETCNLPVGNYMAEEISQEIWKLEIKDNKIIETADFGEKKITSSFIRDPLSDCSFRMTVTQIEGEEEDVKIGDRFVISVLQMENNKITIRAEDKRSGVILTLLKLK